MISQHFRLNSELSGAIAKKLPHAKNQLSVPGSFFNQFVTDIYIYIRIYIYIYEYPYYSNSINLYIYIYKRASLACAARLADTLCPPEAPCVRLG